MIISYNDNFNFDLGVIGKLHPFDGTKFRRVYQAISQQDGFEFISPEAGVSQVIIDEFVGQFVVRYLKDKVFIYRALEVPKIPFLGMEFLDKKILTPMRWGVAGTLLSAQTALTNKFCWNLSGGYHHASQHSIEGFCIYNDIGITYQELIKSGHLSETDKILIIDTDAHHGNGNARTFMDNPNVTLLDIYNYDVYPKSSSTRERVNISAPVHGGTAGDYYLDIYGEALAEITQSYKIAFVVAGTDVLDSDKIGGLSLTQDDIVAREVMTVKKLQEYDIPTVMLSGGGYSKQTADAIVHAMKAVAPLL